MVSRHLSSVLIL